MKQDGTLQRCRDHLALAIRDKAKGAYQSLRAQIVMIGACHDPDVRRHPQHFINHRGDGTAHDPLSPERARQPESGLAVLLLIGRIRHQPANHPLVPANREGETRSGIGHRGRDIDVFVPPKKFVGMVLAVGIGHPRQPAGHRPVIEPGDKVVTVGRTEWPQAVCLVYLYVHRRKMKAVT